VGEESWGAMAEQIRPFAAELARRISGRSE
jgi:hypothetical protein